MRYCDNFLKLRSQKRNDSNGRNPDGETTSTGTSSRGRERRPSRTEGRSASRRRERSSSRARHRSASRHDQQKGNPSPILKKSAHITFAPLPPHRTSHRSFANVIGKSAGGGHQHRRVTPTDRDTPEIDEDLDKLPTTSQQSRTLEEVRQRLLLDPMSLRRGTEGPSRCLFAWRLAAAMSQEHAVTSLVEQKARTRRALTLDSLWGLFEVQKAIEERSALRAHVCAECGATHQHLIGLQAHILNVHAPKRTRKASYELLRIHARGAYALKRERWSEFLNLFK